MRISNIKFIAIITISIFCVTSINAQSIGEIQAQNARATGYAIVAARNPGRSFSIYMIKWDGVNSLEYNANTQINPGWHPQAAIKGNYFDQTFVNSSFTGYSSVVISQSEFDAYKSTGSDWWIVCSTLPSFSNSSAEPLKNLKVESPIDTFSAHFSGNGLTNGVAIGTSADNVGIVQGYSKNFNTLTNMAFQPYGGNVGIGITKPTNKLDVNGTIHSKEVKVDMTGWSDFVFKKDYNLPTLQEVEKHIAEKGHLQNIPSEEEVLKNGINLGEMDSKLLRKIEELTLYIIEQNKSIEDLKQEIKNIKSKDK
ncbi:hypothetical protein [Flavobacterium sp. DG2-3]|uniref:hypothetical protein n=1 Tax=Flavobacterium sp. DG2-3 TaxID=3068317 RepID=UPI00273D6FD4|nr:hypothetical protein [Flavobacterium sp. DG2-3]MDP5202026.1 hypothetical protein [Flavobacterium sp. DG2-3]